MATMKRGVSLYSYQQTRFFKELDLEGEIREVGRNLEGADGIEIVDEMSLRYPDPGDDFVRRWFGWMEQYGTRPVTMDVGMDVLQFRDHVMSLDECTERLRHDMRLAKRLGFANVRVLSVLPFEMMEKALPLAEELDIRLGKEIHQPMSLEGQQVGEIIEFVGRTGTRHLGIVPDFGIFGTRPSEAMLGWYERKGAKPEATALAVELAGMLKRNETSFSLRDLRNHTAGNLRAEYRRYLTSGEASPGLRPIFDEVVAMASARISNATELDLIVVAEALMLSDTSADTLRQMAKHVVNVHAKFYNMTEVPGRPGCWQDISIDYDSSIAALKAGGYTGYLNTEYEGQRYYQDRTRAEMMSEVEQVRRHQEMLRRLIAQ
jgi:hypothetical protein